MNAAAIIVMPATADASSGYLLTSKGHKATRGRPVTALDYQAALLSTLSRIERREWRA